MASKVTPSIPGAPSFLLAISYAARRVSILQTWTYSPQKRQDGSAFALTYILRLRSCKSMDAFVISSLPSPMLETLQMAGPLPVLRTLSLCTCCRHYPGAAAGRTLRSASPSRISLPRKGCRGGLRIVLFGDCSAFTRVTACTLALSPIRDTLIEGFSHFVTSMTAPIASGWSGCRVGLAPTGKRRLVTAHTQAGHRARSAP